MESLSNGEISDDCLKDTLPISDKVILDCKGKNAVEDELGNGSLEKHASQQHAANILEISSDPIDSANPEKESSNKMEISTETVVSNLVESTDEAAKAFAVIENGLSGAENHAKTISSTSDKSESDVSKAHEKHSLHESDVVETVVHQEESPSSNTGTLIKEKNDLETILPPSPATSNKENCTADVENNMKTTSSSDNKVADENCSSSNTISKETCSLVEDNEHPSLENESMNASPSIKLADKESCPSSHRSDASELVWKINDDEKDKLNVAAVKNHLLSEEAILVSEENKIDPQNLKSLGSQIPVEDHIMDISDTVLENCNNASDANEPLDCSNVTIKSTNLKETEESLDSIQSGDESNKILDFSSTSSPNEKLKESLVSETHDVKPEAVSGLAEKVVSNTSTVSSPVTKTPVSESHLLCDKENKATDSSKLQEKHGKESSDSFVFADLTNEETGFPDAFSGLVKIGKYISVKGDFTLRSSEALVESPSLIAPYLLKEPDSFPPRDKDSKSEIKDFFHSAAGEILIGIGLSRVNEFYHKDMVRIKKRQLKRNATPELEEDLTMHEKFYSEAKKANNVYSFQFSDCKTCGFTSESAIVMEGHLLEPHLTQRREYQCNFCDSINRDPKGILLHMQESHRKIGRIQPPVLSFECPYCAFENNSKVKLNHHLLKCQRVFDQGVNQAPSKDFEFPALTPKPITVAVVKAYEKSLGSMQRGRGRPKKEFAEAMLVNKHPSNTNVSPLAAGHLSAYRGSSGSPLADSLMQNQMMSAGQMIRPAHSGAMNQLRPGMHMPVPNRFFGVNPNGQLIPLIGSNHLVTSPSQFPFSTNLDNSGSKKSSSSSQYYNKVFDINQRQPNSKGSGVTITPLPKLTGPYPVPMSKPSMASGSNPMTGNSLVVCEICDGYIKDLEQLRTHMQLIHKVKIHPKMLVSRPPLNCQKCQWRFFTDQGLERHLLGAHGLVTSNMQELANKGKDAGCCTICGRVYASKLVSHMNQVHKITLKPAHLSYKCTVCSATFNLYRLFENHVYLVHSGAGKRSADGRSSPSKKLKNSGDSPAEEESSNHKEKKPPSDVGDENAKKCKGCGTDISKDKKSQSDMCEKCLKSDKLAEDSVSAKSKTIKDELKQTDKTVEKAAV